MFTLPNFCRVCLKYDKNLIDLAHIENEPSETLMSKLQLCVSEVEWTTFKPLLCHPCIKRLNIAYSFKKQCVQSSGVLKNYVELVRESQKKNESQNAVKSDPTSQSGAYMLLPNQKYVKILVGNQNQGSTGNANSFQNVFLNLIPTTTIRPVPNTGSDSSAQKSKDTNQNVFLNLNNTFQKFIPLSTTDPPPLKKQEKKQKESLLKNNQISVSEVLKESKAEEMSVEIDPTAFLSLEHDDPSDDEDDAKNNDWDEMITKQKVDSTQPKLNGSTVNGNDLPKDDLYSGGHFLSSPSQTDINCETCQRSFPSIRLLKQHFKQFHLGKFPFKCTYCYMDHLTRTEYENCLSRHKKDMESQNTSLTLKDFADGNASCEIDALSMSLIAETPADLNLEPNENGEYVCEHCKRIFNSSAGLLRHRVRKHNQKNRKKYFIKGMKNAKCDICKREFSTQSYMQLHRKLHMREEGGYKYKVPGKSKFKDLPGEDKDKQKGEDEEINDTAESIDVTPDISMLQEQEDSESDSEIEQESANKKIKLADTIKDQEGNSMSSNDVEMNKESESSGETDDSDKN